MGSTAWQGCHDLALDHGGRHSGQPEAVELSRAIKSLYFIPGPEAQHMGNIVGFSLWQDNNVARLSSRANTDAVHKTPSPQESLWLERHPGALPFQRDPALLHYTALYLQLRRVQGGPQRRLLML